ncbi:MAG: VWA domain-containing protein [Chloroflexi bacterium]|nr:VWA domain-containing protein [Chloroflexota bacterium]
MLLAPLALILGLLAVPIILLCVLALRRPGYVVPSTFLWRQALEDVQANAPWQRLRFNILLLLQLLALAALILALARPAYSRSHVIAGDLVMIVDESYGMQAHDVAPSRFAAALDRARTLASELGSGSVMSVIGMSAQPHLAIAESGDAGAIGRAIGSLRVGVDQPNFLEALSLAASLARAGQSTRAVVLTSRDSGIATLPLQVSFPVDVVRIGGRLRDLAITAFSASPHAAGGSSGALPGGALDAVARVSNFGSQAARSDLELLADGQLVDVRPLTVPAHQVQNLFWTGLPAGIGRLQARLTLSDDVGSDKSAWAAVPAEPARRVLLVSRGDFFLQAALLDYPSVRLTVVSPAAYTPGMERPYDLAIFDGFLPPAFPAGSALFVAPPAGRVGPLRFDGNLPAGAVEASSGAAGPLGPLLRYVDLSDVHVAQARSVSLPGWLQPLAQSAGTGGQQAVPLVAAGERGNARVVLVDFSLERSDWPLRISFPIMLQNLLRYLAPGLTLGQTNVTTGQAVTFFPPPGTRRLEVVKPGGAAVFLRPPFPPFTDTAQPGLYQVKALAAGYPLGAAGPTAGSPTAAGSAQAEFAVNFFPARPAPAPGAATVHLGRVQVGTRGSAEQVPTASLPIDIDWAFLLLGLGILALEWWVSFRGVPTLRREPDPPEGEPDPPEGRPQLS